MTTSYEPHCIAIVGAGFSGTLTAIQVTRQIAARPLQVTLIEQGARFGRGVAYSTACQEHLLNVPAGNMSALPDEPGHFVAWALRHGVKAGPGAFLPRGLYGDYLADLLTQAARTQHVELIHGSVIDVRSGHDAPELVLEGGRRIFADHVVLAAGNFPPADPAICGLAELDKSCYVRDPWAPGALDGLLSHDAVLLIGTGLTMVDIAIELQVRGHRGPIHAVSRRGLVPQAHRPAGQQCSLSVPPEVLQAERTAAGLLRGVRAAIRRERRLGHDWRDVVAALRPITATLWQSLPPSERARFLRHVRPYWDTHRHRSAPAVAATIAALRESGQLNVHAARITRLDQRGDLVRATLQRRAGDTAQVDVVRVVNCTGPESDVRRLNHPFWQNLLERGLIQPDEFGLGVLTDPEGAVCDQNGRPSTWLSLIGPLRKAQLWECTAVPELRTQACALAQRLVERASASRHKQHQVSRQSGCHERAAAASAGEIHD